MVLPALPSREIISEEIIDSIEKRIILSDTKGCYIWTGNVSKAIKINKRSYSVHYVLFTHYNGEIETGNRLIFTCQNPRCMNKDHMRLTRFYSDGEKRCPVCKELKRLDEFSDALSSNDPNKKQSYCKLCIRNYEKSQNKKRNRTWDHRSRVYGINQIQYEDLVGQQKGECKICGVKLWNKLVVDHCHTAGIIRGLLCKPCNFMLGNAKDDIRILENGIKYLKSNSNIFPL